MPTPLTPLSMSGPKAPPGFVSCTKAEFGSKGNSPEPWGQPRTATNYSGEALPGSGSIWGDKLHPKPLFWSSFGAFLAQMGLERPRIPAGPGATDKSNPKKLREGLNAEFSSGSIPDFQEDKPVTMKPFVPPQPGRTRCPQPREGSESQNPGNITRLPLPA